VTIFYPDISAYEAGIAISGPAVCIKATEGTGWLNQDYAPAMARAKAAGTFAFAYHFLHAGNAAAQAAWCHQHAGSTPLMIDWEPATGSSPSVADATGFTDAYRALGGTVHLAYFPHWYWHDYLGSPPLSLIASRGLHLVSSDYTSYSDGGPGWAPYGGMTPAVWQYTDAQQYGGQPCDFNAWKGTLAEFEALVGGKAPPPPPPLPKGPAFPYPAADYLGTPSPDPHCHSGYWGGPDQVNVHTWQAKMHDRGWVIAMDGRYGPASEGVARLFQAEKGLAADGKVGPVTWAATWTAPL
jgi:glycosyl hydrolase family 25/putative peptidoglycan binding protein